MRPTLAILFLAAAAGCATVASAGVPGDRRADRFETRQASQSERIDAGIAAGQIGTREQALLGHQQASIDRAFDRRSADGRIGARDARALDRRLDRSRSAIGVARWRGTRG